MNELCVLNKVDWDLIEWSQGAMWDHSRMSQLCKEKK